MSPLWRPGDAIDPLRALLARGGILAIPTESSYGLAVDPRNAVGVEAIYRVKSRERGKLLPIVAANLEQLEVLGVWTQDEGIRRAAAVWPAALTVVAPILQPIAASAGERTLGVRIPADPQLVSLLRELGMALTATSANRSGEPPLLDPVDVTDLLAVEDAMVMDGGVLPGGTPSTLVAWRGDRWEVLRRGRFEPSALPGASWRPR